jgi:hypothetical protein
VNSTVGNRSNRLTRRTGLKPAPERFGAIASLVISPPDPGEPWTFIHIYPVERLWFGPIVGNRAPWKNQRTTVEQFVVTKIKNMNQSTKQNCARRQPAARSSLLKLCLTGTALAWGLTASAQTFTTSTNFTVDAIIPDGDASGLASVQTISTPITNLTGLRVALKVSGTWNGDLYCFLAHGPNHSVLLNRLGRATPATSATMTLAWISFSTMARLTGDIHVYRLQLSGSQGTPLPGTLTDSWAPDARVTSPINVLDTDARSAFSGSFNGVDPNGEWVLFVADLEAGDIHFLDSWGLEITGDTAPTEPEQSLAQSAEGSSGGATLSGMAPNQVPSQLAAATAVAPPVLRESLLARPGSG